MNQIPTLDLAKFRSGDPSDKQAFANELGAAYEAIGFVAVKNHDLSEVLCKNLYESVEQFFSLPEEVKLKYANSAIHGQRGYTGKGKEHAKGRTVGDLKEFYHIGQEGLPVTEDYPANIWPEEVPEFKKYAVEAYRTLEYTGKLMLRAIALYLGLDEFYFDGKVEGGNSILRPIHYFPINDPENMPEDAVRAAEHGDINLITLLMGASAEGLQVLRRDGKWIPVNPALDQLVVNVGDMLDRHTNGKLKSTIHRVVNPPKEKMKTSRYSIPFFMHPKSEVDLSCLSNCIDESHPKQYEDMTAGKFLDQRLREIGLMG